MWLFAQHGTPYDHLPDYFIAYDIWENNKFLNANEVRTICQALGISCSPSLEFGARREGLLALASGKSLSGIQQREGIYCRIEFTQSSYGHPGISRDIANRLQTRSSCDVVSCPWCTRWGSTVRVR